jgi:uncharacterized membrane protein
MKFQISIAMFIITATLVGMLLLPSALALALAIFGGATTLFALTFALIIANSEGF